jgi:hypothetical protein
LFSLKIPLLISISLSLSLSKDALADTSQRLHLVRSLISDYDYYFASHHDEDEEDADPVRVYLFYLFFVRPINQSINFELKFVQGHEEDSSSDEAKKTAFDNASPLFAPSPMPTPLPSSISAGSGLLHAVPEFQEVIVSTQTFRV